MNDNPEIDPVVAKHLLSFFVTWQRFLLKAMEQEHERSEESWDHILNESRQDGGVKCYDSFKIGAQNGTFNTLRMQTTMFNKLFIKCMDTIEPYVEFDETELRCIEVARIIVKRFEAEE